MGALLMLALLLAGAPRRVTDDNGCNKGIDANNELHGEIVCTRDGEKQYEGTYAHGKRVGSAKTWSRGKLRRLDHFADGKKNGLCEEYDPDGFIQESCTWKDDQKHGPCKLYGREGKLREERHYVAGAQRGPYIEYHLDGTVAERGALDEAGRRHGTLERFREDGSAEESTPYVHGQREGVAKQWHPNGKLRREETFHADLEHGLTKTFHENGQLEQTSCYQGGQQVTGTQPCTGKTGPEIVTRFFPNGKVSESTVVRDGKRNGQHQSFDRDGRLTSSETLVDDRLDGVQKRFKEGKLERQTSWKAQRRDGPETLFFDDGTVSEETIWKDGRRQSTTRWWMNGKKKHAEVLEGALWRVAEWFDNGQQASEVTVAELGYRARIDGLERRWAENGTLVSQSAWKAGKRHGTSKRWFESGQAQAEEEWADDVRLSMKSWDDKGKLLADERYNADGSRK